MPVDVFKATPHTYCLFVGYHVEINQDVRSRIVKLHKSVSSIGTISRSLKVPKMTCINKLHTNFWPTFSSGRRWVLNSKDESLWSQMCKSPPGKSKPLLR
ncbi:hypothetical protein CHARACLAT_022477 [Characodon lateralis]|uniref:Uncharacterized protein n=1 Tax=Characodon lateralis TaxID=208331 RepID=A0ABU7DJC8_9TELE|nr:hypothetical protein [Characodon lateralis]